MGDDYIKREDAIKAVANAYWHGTDCECYAFAHKALDNAPTVDAVPVVRCKDCKWWTEWANGTGSCNRFTLDWIGTDADDFCSMGEKRR